MSDIRADTKRMFDEFKRLFDTPVDADGIPVGNPPMSNWPRVTI